MKYQNALQKTHKVRVHEPTKTASSIIHPGLAPVVGLRREVELCEDRTVGPTGLAG